ncbi:MAG: hypothetical protein KJO54_08070 [Gammaproteobacteria bacterium]|nr:hypothetical protein [Gammaproteobacteria bacterium]NNF60081.1 hypothetical protein [Gammaproteobacteria bacterium]NNM21160.1 hypothetical protein [Gammaproteobacteria bacterium]
MTPDEASFLQDFEACTLPAEAWTHRAHIHMGWLQLQRAPYPDALARIRAGIRRFNTEVLARRQQYHDTVTIAFTRLIAAALRAGESFDAFCDRNPELLAKNPGILQYHYSADLLATDAARTGFVEPDLAPLPPAPEP